MKIFLTILNIAIFSFSLLYGQNSKNVVIILVDDLGWKDLGYSGSPLYQTPHIDALAAESTVYSQAYSAHPVCSPSRAALLTGKNPIRIGISDWIPGRNPTDRILLTPEDIHQLPLTEVTLAEILKKSNYTTFFAGKWHLGDHPYIPENQGFDINIGGIDKGSPPGGYYTPYNNPKLPDGPKGEYLTDRLTTETLDFISSHKNQPFLAYLSYYTVHTPIQANEEFRTMYTDVSVDHKTMREGKGNTLLYQDNMDYASMVTAMDNNVGRIVNHLKLEGLWKNTILVFTSDNGGLSTLADTYKAEIPTSTYPLRGGKGWGYEGGIRIPLIIHDAGQTKQLTDPTPVIHMDILPTVLAALEIQADIVGEGEGVNILYQNVKTTPKDRTFFWHYPHYHGSGWTPGSALRKGDWKLIYYYETEVSELYNLHKDESENVNLALKYPEKADSLRREMFELIDASEGKYPHINANIKK